MEPTRPSLLVVEDEPAIRFATQRYLECRGFHVDAVASLAEAHELLFSRRYDLVLSDLCLSSRGATEGLDLLAYAGTCAPQPKRALFSAFLSDDVVARARQMGIDLVVTKGERLDRLSVRLRALVSPEVGHSVEGP